MRGALSDASTNAIAIEYASWPVEQPGTQARSGSSPRCAISLGKTLRTRTVKALGSRKKLVTLISTSEYSASSPLALPRRKLA